MIGQQSSGNVAPLSTHAFSWLGADLLKKPYLRVDHFLPKIKGVQLFNKSIVMLLGGSTGTGSHSLMLEAT